MKGAKVLAIFGGILAILLGVLYFVSKEPQDDIALEEDFVSLEALIELTKEDLDKIVIENEQITASFLPTDEGFIIEGTEDLSLNTSSITAYANRLLTVYSSKKLDSPASLAEYGLDTPSEKITYALKDGSDSTLTLGDRSPGSGGVYALKDEDPSVIYIIPTTVISSLDAAYSNHRTDVLDTLDPTTVSRIEMKGRDLDHYIIRYLESDAENYYLMYQMESPYKILVSSDAYGKLLEAVPPLSVETYVADRVEDFSIYGLDNPSLWLSLEIVDQAGPTSTLEYLWGDTTEDGKIYFMPKGSTSVYAMEAAPVTKLLSMLDPYELSSKLVHLVNIDKINALELTLDGKTLHLEIERAGEEVTYLLDGHKIDEKDFKNLYQSIIGISSDVRLDSLGETQNTSIASIRYTLTDGQVQESDFYFYNNQFYSYELAPDFFVGCNTKQFDHILTLASQIEPIE